MGLVERYRTVLVVLAVLGGLAVGRASGVPALAESLILLFLLVMLFGAFAAIPLSSLREAFRNRRVVGASWGSTSSEARF